MTWLVWAACWHHCCLLLHRHWPRGQFYYLHHRPITLLHVLHHGHGPCASLRNDNHIWLLHASCYHIPIQWVLIAIKIFTSAWTGYFLSAFEVCNILPVWLAITATDNGGATATYALTINVKPINRAPVFSPKSCSVNFNDNQVGIHL